VSGTRRAHEHRVVIVNEQDARRRASFLAVERPHQPISSDAILSLSSRKT
jgi:hypothetical protein